MIEIKITDPHLTDKNALRKTVSYLLAMIGDEIELAPEPSRKAPPVPQRAELPPQNQTPPPALFVPPAPIAPAVPAGLAVPAAPVAPSAPAITNGVELDANGLPWDTRIHSRTKSKMANGQWKLKREISQDLVAQVQAELRQALAAPAIPSNAPVPVPPPAPPVPPPSAMVSAPPTVFEDPIEAPQNDFPALMSLVAEHKASGKLNHADVNAIMVSFGLPSLPLAATRPDLIPAIILAIKEKVA